MTTIPEQVPLDDREAVGSPGPPVPGRTAAPGITLRPGSASRRRLITRVKWVFVAILALALIIAVVRAWMPEPVPVELARATVGPMEITVNEDGRTRVHDRYTVSAPLAGTLIRPVLRAGDRVRRGEVVARLIPAISPLLDVRSRAEAEARVAAANAGLEQATALVTRTEAQAAVARREAERRRALFDGGGISREELESAELSAETARHDLLRARAGLEVARADLALARAALARMGSGNGGATERFDLRSPITGQVLRILQESETVVQPGAPLLEIGDPATLEAVVDVLSADAIEIRPGAEVAITQWGGDELLRGRVRLVEPSAFTRLSALGVEEQRVNVIVDPDPADTRWRNLGDGYRVEARIQVWRGDEVLRVPAGAVFSRGDSWAVYIVEGGKARLRPVKLGRRNETEAQVLGGVDEGTNLVVYPGETVKDGVRISHR